MSTILHCLLISTVGTTLAHAGELEFWNGAREVMSERQVLKLFPGGTRPSDPESLITGTLGNLRRTGIEGLRDCTVTYEGLPACGRFYFEDKKLVGVNVELRDLDRTQPARTAEI